MPTYGGGNFRGAYVNSESDSDSIASEEAAATLGVTATTTQERDGTDASPEPLRIGQENTQAAGQHSTKGGLAEKQVATKTAQEPGSTHNEDNERAPTIGFGEKPPTARGDQESAESLERWARWAIAHKFNRVVTSTESTAGRSMLANLCLESIAT